MLFFKSNDNGDVVEVSEKVQNGTQWFSRWQMDSFETAERVAASASKATGRLHIAIDNTTSVSPRYDVIEAPKVGDEVSYGFNGDSYPDGTIVKIGKNLKIITTSTGHRYYRRKLMGRWVQTGGTWSLIQGHHNERNPSF